ncbi:hypothetical protein [Paraburkholderia bryophila]|uniref:Uncharacterized protein n=1 Tax=Paraburkholderia bryophila TaxID=420952 RepID=A0A7Y9W5B8_9BURK|nr:hypothetical protein [Paraburkholderia bryophila]
MPVHVEAFGEFAFARQTPFFAETARGDFLGEDLFDLPPYRNASAAFEHRARRRVVVRCHGAVIPLSSNYRYDVHCSAQAVMEM